MRVLMVLMMVACGGAAAPGGEKPAATANPAAPAKAAAASSDALAPGAPAPDVTLTLHDGTKTALSSLKGKSVLVYFYPKDDTPGCTVEAQGLRDGWADIQAAGLQVFGVSTQDAASHQAFIDKHELPFPLVVDTDGAVAAAFKVPLRGGFAARQSFLIGPDGALKRVWTSVDPKEHAAEVIAAAR
jgi:peroxiredoxin Q/BCP